MKRLLLRWLIGLGLYPHIYFTYSPFKILEFEALTASLTWTGHERVLDIGCGAGLHTCLIERRCDQIVGIDVEPAHIAEARWLAKRLGPRCRAEFMAAPLQQCRFADASFDRIFSICVIEHIADYESVLADCQRILKPSGEMLFTVDTLETITDPELVAVHRRAHHVQQYFRRDSLRALLAAHGLVVDELRSLFRSPLARELFTRGIRTGFNFGRFATRGLTDRLAQAEAAHPDPAAPGIFLLARCHKPDDRSKP